MTRVRMPGLLDGELQEVARLRVRAGQYQLNADDVSQATLTIPEDGPVVGLRDWVSLYDVDGLMGVYRVTNIAQTVKRSIQLTLLHGIDILADSYWAEEREYTGNVRGYLEALLAQQTALIDGTAPWALGDCEDTETTLKGVKISYGRLSELIREAVPEGGGYQLEYDQTVWPWRVHVRAKPTSAAAEFRVARNITSATVTYNDADLCTRLILSNTSGGESRVRVYNAGAIAQAEWGIVTKTASIDTSDTLTSESWPEAEAWVAEFFRQHAAPSVQIQIEGRELYRLTGDRWDRASLGRVCRVSLPEYGHVFEERVVSLTYPNPWEDDYDHGRVIVSLANALPQFSEQVKLIEKTAKSASRAAGGAARKADQTAEELERKEVIYETAFQKTDRQISGIASATGLQFNADGTPVLDEDGNFVYDEDNPENSIYSQLILAAGNITSLTETTSGLSSRITQTESAIETEVTNRTNADNGLSSRITQNAGAITSEVSRAQSAENTLSSRITQTESDISLVVSDGAIKSASIILAINGSGGSSTTISADKVNISGNVNLNDVITVGSGGAVGTFNSLTINGGANLGSSNVYYNNVPLSSFIKSISLTGPTNNVYTLTWENAGGTPTSKTFSRAASGISVSWSGTQGTVTVQPQNQQFSITYDGPSSASVDAITITNTPVTGTLYTGSGGTRYGQADLDLAAWHNNEDETQTQLKTQTAQLRMNIESILSSAESTAAAAATAAAGVAISGTSVAVSSNSGTKSIGISARIKAANVSYNSTTGKYSITPTGRAGSTDMADGSAYTLTPSEAEDAGWNAAADAIVWPTGTGSSVSVTVPEGGGMNDTGSKALYLVDDTTNSKILLRDVNSASASGNTYAEKAYTGGGASVSSVGLYFDNEALEDVTTPFSVDNNYTVYPIAKMSDGTRRVGSAVRLTTTISLYDLGTITPTSSQQTFNVPTGYAGFAGPIRVAAASGGGGTVSYSTSSVSNSSVPGSADIVFIADRQHSVRIDIKQNGSTVKTLYVGPPLS